MPEHAPSDAIAALQPGAARYAREQVLTHYRLLDA